MDEVNACGMCVNAYVDDELSSDNDLSFFGIGTCSRGFRLLLRSGASRPTELLVERHFGTSGWLTVGTYKPKYCPNCGRELIENSSVSSM